MLRFVLVKEPTGKWTVFDDAVGIPAQYAGRDLIGLTCEDAEFSLLQCRYPSFVSRLLPYHARSRAADAATCKPHEDAP